MATVEEQRASTRAWLIRLLSIAPSTINLTREEIERFVDDNVEYSVTGSFRVKPAGTETLNPILRDAAGRP